jgi:succinoglycan biosynthesis transport protein ExoP
MYGKSPGADVLDWLVGVWSRRRWLAAIVFALTAAITVTVVLSLPNIYLATATVLVEQASLETTVPGELEMRLQVISQEIFSRSRLEALIGAFDLYPSWRRGSPPEAVVAQMRRDIRTEFKYPPQAVGPPAGSTVAFNLSYRGTDPQTVARVANALASLYLEQDRKIRQRQTSGTVELLKAQLEDVKRDLEEQDRSMAEFQDQHMGELPQQADANLAALARFHAELRTTGEEKARALSRRDDLTRRWADADTSSPRATPDVAAARLARLKSELLEMKRRYSDKYPEVIRLKTEVAALEQEVAEGIPEPVVDGAPSRAAVAVKESLREVETEIDNLRADEARLRAQMATYVQRLENAPRRQRGFQGVSRDYQTTRELYDSLRKRYEQALLEQDGGRPGPQFRILDPAVVPSGAVAPNRMVLLFLALLGSLAVTAAAVVLAERLDTSFHAADDVQSFTRVPVLASIPLIFTAGDRRVQQRRFLLAAVSVLLALGAVVHLFHGFARNQETLVSMLVRG